jgi:transcriptional regulator with XRE-family HTH domain
MRTRKAMGVRVEEMAKILGVDRATLYRWEADGFFRAHTHVAALVLQWLIAMPERELQKVAVLVRGRLDKGQTIECQLELHVLMLKQKKSA